MIPVRVNENLRLSGGYQEYEIDSERDLELTFTAEEDCDVFVRIRNAVNLRVRWFIAHVVKASVLFWNVSGQPVKMDQSADVMRNSDLTMAFGECGAAQTDINAYVALREEGAQSLLSTASLVSTHKNYHLQTVNFAPHTYGDMKNYAVVLNKGVLMIDAVGSIVKGAYRSESHQTSRALSFEEGQKSTILPELLIDENDVQASHAMSIGRMDEDQLYYMMSRGLSVQQCTSLISTGYLMPVTEVLKNESLRQKLKEEMERKIGEICSM